MENSNKTLVFIDYINEDTRHLEPAEYQPDDFNKVVKSPDHCGSYDVYIATDECGIKYAFTGEYR